MASSETRTSKKAKETMSTAESNHQRATEDVDSVEEVRRTAQAYLEDNISTMFTNLHDLHQKQIKAGLESLRSELLAGLQEQLDNWCTEAWIEVKKQTLTHPKVKEMATALMNTKEPNDINSRFLTIEADMKKAPVNNDSNPTEQQLKELEGQITRAVAKSDKTAASMLKIGNGAAGALLESQIEVRRLTAENAALHEKIDAVKFETQNEMDMIWNELQRLKDRLG